MEAGQDVLVGVIALVQRAAVGLDHLLGVLWADHALRCQPFRVELAGAGVPADELVHQRLGDHGFVLLVVPVAAEADQVDHHVLLELHAEVQRNFDGEAHGFRVVAVDVKDRCIDHLHDVRAVQSRACVARVGGGEADLVVDDHMHRAAGAIAARLRQIERLHYHTLSRKGGIAMDQHREDLPALAVLAAMLARPHRPLHHRVDDFEVGRVESERQMHWPTGRVDVRREPLVVLNVAGRQIVDMLALELREQVLGHLTHGVDQDIEPSAMGHADDRLLHALLAGPLQQVVEQRDEALAALQGEALLPDVAGVQVALQRLGCGQPLEYEALEVRRIVRLRARGLQALLNPAAQSRVGDVPVFGADRSAVGLAQRAHDLPQRHLLGPEHGRGVERRLHVLVGQPVGSRVELRDVRLLEPLQRIDVGLQHAEPAIVVGKLQHPHLLASELRRGRGRRMRRRGARGLDQLDEGLPDRLVRHVRRAGQLLKLVEVAPPLRRHRCRVGQVRFVQLLDERRVGAEQIRGAQILLQQCSHFQSLMAMGTTLRGCSPMNSWRGRPIFCSGSEIISFH